MKTVFTKFAFMSLVTLFSGQLLASENRTEIRKWAKTHEKRAAVMAGGLVSIPQSGSKKQEVNESDTAKKEEKKGSK